MAGYDVIELAELSRDRICWSHPYLAPALARLKPKLSADRRIERFATDGVNLCLNDQWAQAAFDSLPETLDRALLHALAHCLLGHMYLKDAALPRISLACDVQATLLCAALAPELMDKNSWPLRELLRRFTGAETVEGVLRLMDNDGFVRDNRKAVIDYVSLDSHALWQSDLRLLPRAGGGDSWGDLARRLRLGSGSGNGYGRQGGATRRSIDAGSADARMLAHYLRRYSLTRENPRDDPDSFQYAWYVYGLEQYGNVPLIEPTEYREEKRIDALVIVIDTSGSCARGLTKRFLELVRGLLAETGLFFRRFNLRILQCDARVQRDDLICDMRAFERYIDNLEVVGGGGTDFRCAIEYINALRDAGKLRGLRGVLYFSDGRGIYPETEPDYELTFVFLKHRFDAIDTPAWARRIVIDMPLPRHGDPDEY